LSGAPWLRGESLAQRADALIRRYPLGQNLISIPATQWLHESWRIAERDAYPPGNAKVPTISTEFDTRSKEIANQRIVLAGCRLADLLRRLLRDSGLR